MKTAIIQLENYDNLYSIQDRMKWSRANRILLVWPKRGWLIDKQIDLGILQRHAGNLGAQIAFVSRDASIIESANHLNISVFSSVPAAESSRWAPKLKIFSNNSDSQKLKLLQQTPRIIKKTKSNIFIQNIVRGMAIFLSFLAIISLWVFLLPSARVVLFPVTHEKEIVFSVWASPQVHEVNINGNIPAIKKQIEVSAEFSGQSSGTTGIPSQFASGEITFTNLTNLPITIPAGTIVSSKIDPSIRFSTLQDVILPSGKDPTAIAEVKAINPGANGNQGAGIITVVEGSIAEGIEAINDLPITGGSDEQAPSPTEQDYLQAKNRLMQELKQKALEEFKGMPEILIPDSLDDGKIVSEQRTLEPGQPGEQFNLIIAAKFTGFVYSASDLNLLSNMVLAASLGSVDSNYVGSIDHQSNTASQVVISENGAKWSEIITAQIGPVINKSLLAQLITGKNKEETEQILLSNVNSRQSPNISIQPSFWKWLPLVSYQIQIQAK
ncbi:MAG: baseplate J/gp47 family protein [Anaerolineaceae bacterium]